MNSSIITKGKNLSGKEISFYTKRNNALLYFFRKANVNARLIGNIINPAIIVNNKIVLLASIKKYELLFKDANNNYEILDSINFYLQREELPREEDIDKIYSLINTSGIYKEIFIIKVTIDKIALNNFDLGDFYIKKVNDEILPENISISITDDINKSSVYFTEENYLYVSEIIKKKYPILNMTII